jgi:hypothetical protein
VAASTGLHAFLRAFGFVWVFTIPLLVFKNRIQAKIDVVEDPKVRAVFTSGEAYSQVNSEWFNKLQDTKKLHVLHLYELSVSSIWYNALAFSLLRFLLVFIEKRIVLRQNLVTEFGLEDKIAHDTREGVA